MADEMSNPYLLTLMGDRIDELDKMVKRLRNKDSEYVQWSSDEMKQLEKHLKWLKSQVSIRLSNIKD